jgi:hypothetical protein
MQGEIVEDDDTGEPARGIVNARMIAVIISQMINDGVVGAEARKRIVLRLVVKPAKLSGEFGIGRLETVDEEIDLGFTREVR